MKNISSISQSDIAQAAMERFKERVLKLGLPEGIRKTITNFDTRGMVNAMFTEFEEAWAFDGNSNLHWLSILIEGEDADEMLDKVVEQVKEGFSSGNACCGDSKYKFDLTTN